VWYGSDCCRRFLQKEVEIVHNRRSGPVAPAAQAIDWQTLEIYPTK